MAPLAAVAADTGANDGNTATPIKHVIVIIGENRTFDHMFATYVPKNKGETVFNLLSEGIVKADGTPGAELRESPSGYSAGQGAQPLSAEPARADPVQDVAAAIGRRRSAAVLLGFRGPHL